MGAFILILPVALLLSSVGFTESAELLRCFNNYDTELKCSLKLAEHDSCSENKLNASLNTIIPEVRSFSCHFKEIRPGACECIIWNEYGFFITEILTIKVLKGDKIWLTKNISTEASIKPRRPIIFSVIQTESGNFFITLNTTYTKMPFSESLMVELTYSIDGSTENVTKLLEAGRTTYEIVGRNLQPNSKYILRARMKSGYPPNITFSDYGEPYEFETPPSIQSILKILIPILCLVLIICISLIYFWLDRILKPWWDKIPTPKLSTNFVKQVPWLLSFQTEFLPVSVISTASHIAKKTCVEPSQVQREDGCYSGSLGKGVDPAPLMYSTTGYESVDENSSDNVQEQRPANTRDEQSDEFSSGISNRSYSQSNSSGSSFFKQQFAKVNPNDDEDPESTIQMDYEYSVWNGCTDSGNSTLIRSVPPDIDVEVVFGYQSTDDHDALSSYNDANIEEPFSTKKPQDVPFPISETIVMPMEEAYQAFESVASSNTGL